jgi:hypothetical protein
MKRAVVFLSASAVLSLFPMSGALAGRAEAPAAACNAGTMHAHESVPELTGAGMPIKAHEHIPDSEEGPCVHEAFA